MLCEQFERAIQDEPDGPWPAAASLHLETCPHCRLLRADLDAIRVASRQLSADEAVPSENVWISLRSQLESEGLIHAPHSVHHYGPVPGAGLTALVHRWLGSAPRLAFAGAGLSLLLLAGALLSIPAAPSAAVASGGILATVLPATIGNYAPVDASLFAEVDLDHTLDGDMKRVMASLPDHNASLAISLQENLGIVDKLIAACEKSMREQPDNPVVRQYLYGAYQQKAVLLSTAIDRSTLEDR